MHENVYKSFHIYVNKKLRKNIANALLHCKRDYNTKYVDITQTGDWKKSPLPFMSTYYNIHIHNTEKIMLT